MKMKKKITTISLILLLLLTAGLTACGDGTPSAPTLTVVSMHREAELYWKAPKKEGDSAIIRYEVSKDGGDTWVDVGLETKYTFTDITNGEKYTFKARAINGQGTGKAATVVVKSL